MRLEPLEIEEETPALARSLPLPREDAASQEEKPHQNPNCAGTLVLALQPPDCEGKKKVCCLSHPT